MINLLKNIKTKFSSWKKINNNNFILQSFVDILLLFKSFIHWNISKLIILIYSIVLWFVSVLPIIIIFFIYTFFSDVNMIMLIEWMFSWKLLFNFVWNILLFLIIAIYFIMFSYSNVLLLRLSNSYINWKRINYKNEIYFDFVRIIKYFKLTLLNILILTIPLLILWLLIAILFLFSWTFLETTELIQSWAFNYFTIFSWLFIGISLLVIVYLYYRIIFSFLLLADDSFYKENKKVTDYIKESFNRTKWNLKSIILVLLIISWLIILLMLLFSIIYIFDNYKNYSWASFKKYIDNIFSKINWNIKFLKLTLLISIFFLLILPINYVWEVLENNSNYLVDYSWYMNLTEEQKLSIPDDNMYYYEALKIEFNGKTTEDINKKIKFNYAYIILFTIFNFAFIYWLFIMVFTSFYRKEIV